MSTSHNDMENPRALLLSYESIDARINELGMEPSGMESRARVNATGRLITIYRAVQPILDVLSTLPLLPQSWRDALREFVAALDHFSFKAGKDL
jgi:hypothetical protein